MWPFKRKAKIIDRRNMNEDWQPGDLAVCICDEWHDRHHLCPRKGDRLRVTRITDNVGNAGARCYGLAFEGKPQNLQWECTCFRKLRPTIEPADAKFIAELHDRLHHKEKI